MRLLLEIVIAALLIGVAWNKSFKDWVSEAPLIATHLKPSAQASGPNSKAPVPAATANGSPKSFTGHIYYTDEQGKQYWLDAQGKRHYDK